MGRIHSRDLQQFHRIERSLWRLFHVFGDLCSRCAEKTLREHAQGDRSARQDWGCCMIDNQVHDHWTTLNPIQSHYDRNWYDRLEPISLGKMPGNGPCPALGMKGCRIARCRPVTCTTQLCNKMLKVLKHWNVYNGETAYARQIEDFLDLPDILFALYEQDKKKRKVSDAEIAEYVKVIETYYRKIMRIPASDRIRAVDAVLPSGS